MVFIRNHPQSNTGRTHFKKGNIPWCQGKSYQKKKIKPKIKVICRTCKKEFYVYLSWKKRKFCSKVCMDTNPILKHKRSLMMKGKNNPAYIDGIQSHHYGDDWIINRKKALQRDHYKCQMCTIDKNLDVHHLFPWRICKYNGIINLVTLCKSCHKKLEWGTTTGLKLLPFRMRFLELLGKMWAMNLRKSADYAEDTDPASNLRNAEKFGIPAWKGVLLRLSDKFSRLQQLSCKPPDVVGESITDTLIDTAVYSLLAMILLEDDEKKTLLEKKI